MSKTQILEGENIPQDVRNRPVESDPELSTTEKEIRLVGSNRDDWVRVSTEIPTFIKWLQSISESDFEWIRVDGSGSILAATAKVPKGNIKLQGSSRKSQQNVQMVAYGEEREVEE